MKRVLINKYPAHHVPHFLLRADGQKFEQLAKTPPMGWNSWNRFQYNVSERRIRETADAMISTGMRDAGYQYVNIDDCWRGRDSASCSAGPQRFHPE
jgi:alpha-galactosidase